MGKVVFTTRSGERVEFQDKGKRKAARGRAPNAYARFVQEHIHEFLDTMSAPAAMKAVARKWKAR